MKKTLLYYLFLLVSITGYSQDITVQAEYPSVVEEGQQFTVTWAVNSGGGEFSAPSFEGFYKLMGPQTSYSSSTQIINGKISTQTSYSYVYYLQAVNTGKFVIPPAIYTLKNRTYTSDSMNIEVISGNAAQSPSARSGNTDQNTPEVETSGRDLFVDISLSKANVYAGEAIAATVKIYTRSNLAGINEIKYPDFTGFLKTDIETPPLNSLRQENINGKIYGTGVIQQFLLFPQITGQITIDPVQITVLLQQRSGQSDPFFGDFFSTFETVPKVLVSKPVTINVKPLPGSIPADFSGIVGKIDLKGNVTRDSVNVNDPVNFRITISGSGNLKLAEAPSLKLSPDIELYDPKVTDNIKSSLTGASGQKTFDYLLIPRHFGDFTIPPVTYSYFDVTAGRYERLQTGEFHFYARKGNEQNTGITVYGGVSKEDVQYVGKDIRFIKNKPGRLTRSSGTILGQRSFYSGYVIALLLFLSVLFIRREHVRRNSDLAAVRNRKAGKTAVKRLRQASVCLKNGETDRFYEEILKAIWGYLSHKLNINVSDLTRNNAVSILRDNGIGDEEINMLIDILDTCEYARYAPSASGTGASGVYENTSRFIKSIENLIG